MNDYNIIPMGDNCIPAEVLKQLGLRKCSYPFDWVSHVDYYNATNIIYNFQIVDKLLNATLNVDADYIGTDDSKRIHNNIWFPHDNETNYEERLQKYIRRFNKLKDDIQTKKNIFVFLTRHYVIPQRDFDYIVAQVMKWNPENKIIFICGSAHPYLALPKYRKMVAFQHLAYDIKKLTPAMEYDINVYRPTVKQYLKKLFEYIGINPLVKSE